MKIGDLVKPSEDHFLNGCNYRSSGIILERRKMKKGFAEHVIVLWTDGDVEIEIPQWLEVISENR